jgi:hypothetical protein
MRRTDLDEVISSLWKGHPNFTSLMHKRDVLIELRDKYQAAKNELQERMTAGSQSQDCSGEVPDLGRNPEQFVQEADCEAQNSSSTSKNSRENGVNFPSRGPELEPPEQILQMNGNSCQEVSNNLLNIRPNWTFEVSLKFQDVVNGARETAPSLDPERDVSEQHSEDMRGSEGSSQERSLKSILNQTDIFTALRITDVLTLPWRAMPQ